MSVTLGSLLAVALLASQAPADVRLLPVRGVGLEKANVDAARSRVIDEVKLMGLAVDESDAAPDPACFDNPSCVGPLSGPTAGVLDVEMVRFGPDLIITARFFDRTGELKASAERSVSTEGFQLSGTLLGADFAAAMRTAVDEAPEALLDVDHTVSNKASSDSSAQGVSTAADGAATASDGGGLPIMTLGLAGAGAALIVAGALLTAGGVGGVAWAWSVLNDATSAGGTKELALNTYWGIVAFAGIGAVVFLAGAAVAASSAAVFVFVE